MIGLFVALVTATPQKICSIPTIAEHRYRSRHLHTYRLDDIQQRAKYAIEVSTDWQKLSANNSFASLVFLKSFCALPTTDSIRRIQHRFVLFGPTYNWHHVNFGTFSEMPLGSMSHIFEAHMSKKLAECDKTRADLQVLLDADQLQEWFSQQQISIYHSKIRPFPIGFGYKDYRTVGEADTTVEGFKQLMLRVLDATDAATERRVLLTASFNTHSSLYKDDPNADPRARVLNIIKTTPTLANRSQVNFFGDDRDWLRALRQSKFVASPVGWGPDCHRTYEAIAMGCVPIVVEEYTVSQLLEEMPVLIISSWEVLARGGAEFLEKQYEILCSRQYRLDKLFYDYWERKLHLI